MRVGIALACDAADALGLARHNRAAWHLMEILRKGAGVERVVIVDTLVHPSGTGWPGDLDILAAADAVECCDLIIAVGEDVALAAIARLRARGGRYVLFLAENPYARLVELSLFERGAQFGPTQCHDEIWTFEAFRRHDAILQTIYRCPVQFVPLVWSASVIEEHDRVHQGPGFVLPYARRAGGSLRCVINESNSSAKSMGVLPLLAVNRFHVENPGAIARVEFRNGRHLPNQLTFNFIAANCEVHQQGLLTIWSDQDFYQFLPLKADFVFSHNLDGEVEFDHLDAVFGGYPLLHNVSALSDLGYCYKGGDIDQAIGLLRAMVLGDPANFDADLRESRRRLARFDVENRDNIAAYNKALLNICAQVA